MNATTREVLTPDLQIARLLTANDELKTELEKLYVLTQHLEDDRDKAVSQRDAWRAANRLLQTRLAMLHVGLIDGLDRVQQRVEKLEQGHDRIANHRTSLVTQEQLETQLSDWSATTIRLCRGSEAQAEHGVGVGESWEGSNRGAGASGNQLGSQRVSKTPTSSSDTTGER